MSQAHAKPARRKVPNPKGREPVDSALMLLRAPKPWFRLLEASAARHGIGRAERLRAIAADALAREAAEFAGLGRGEPARVPEESLAGAE